MLDSLDMRSNVDSMTLENKYIPSVRHTASTTTNPGHWHHFKDQQQSRHPVHGEHHTHTQCWCYTHIAYHTWHTTQSTLPYLHYGHPTHLIQCYQAHIVYHTRHVAYNSIACSYCTRCTLDTTVLPHILYTLAQCIQHSYHYSSHLAHHKQMLPVHFVYTLHTVYNSIICPHCTHRNTVTIASPSHIPGTPYTSYLPTLYTLGHCIQQHYLPTLYILAHHTQQHYFPHCSTHLAHQKTKSTAHLVHTGTGTSYPTALTALVAHICTQYPTAIPTHITHTHTQYTTVVLAHIAHTHTPYTTDTCPHYTHLHTVCNSITCPCCTHLHNIYNNFICPHCTPTHHIQALTCTHCTCLQTRRQCHLPKCTPANHIQQQYQPTLHTPTHHTSKVPKLWPMATCSLSSTFIQPTRCVCCPCC